MQVARPSKNFHPGRAMRFASHSIILGRALRVRKRGIEAAVLGLLDFRVPPLGPAKGQPRWAAPE